MPSCCVDSPDRTNPVPQVSLKDLFLAFLKIGLFGFGGVAPVARHVMVEDRAWFTEKEYASLFGISQVLPGGNTINAAAMIGDRFQGLLGAIVATSGLMVMPIAILIVLASLYEHFSQSGPVRVAMSGSASAAAGLILGMAIKMARRAELSQIAVLFGLLAFCMVGLLRFSLVAAMSLLAPLSIAAAFLRWRL